MPLKSTLTSFSATYGLRVYARQPCSSTYVPLFLCSYAEHHRERGNTLFRNKFYQQADQEYQLALNFLNFQPQNDEQQPFVRVKEQLPLLTTMRLNLMATKLKTGSEDEAIELGTEVLEMEPNHPKVLYRLGQAHTSLGNYEKAKVFFTQAVKASAGDKEAVKAVRSSFQLLCEQLSLSSGAPRPVEP